MENKLTKLIENFGLKVENNTFVLGISDKLDKIGQKVSPYVNKLNEDAYFFLCKTRTKAKRSHKYLFGKIRLREFMIDSIRAFDREHIAMVSIIEEGKLIEKSKEYADRKHRISILLRANRRISAKRITNCEMVKSYINTYIHNSRIGKNKYSLAT